MLDLKNITKIYFENKDNMLKVLEDCTLEIMEGDTVIINGNNGAGKTTLLKIIGLLDRRYYGEYKIRGKNVNNLSDKEISSLRNEFFGFLFQDYNLIENESVYYNIEIPLIYSKRFITKQRKNRVYEVCEIFNIKNLINRKVKNLSGGEKQKVALARAIINDPECIILDEPTNSLSNLSKESLVNCMKKIVELKKTIILVTHELSILDSFVFTNKFLEYELENGKLIKKIK